MPRAPVRRANPDGEASPRPASGEARIVSVNVGRPRDWPWEHRIVRTAFLKEPRSGAVELGPLGLAGDECADRSVHGGPKKAVYAYPSEHYPFWLKELGLPSLPWGSFGENLTTEGLYEADLAPGDQLETGGAILSVERPRYPCVKLNARFGRADAMSRFVAAERSGFYLSVVRPGRVRAGDGFSIRRVPRPAPSIGEIYHGRASTDDPRSPG